jgi:catechol 2,3-dioxygenase-like lactoylglutathione lyase family enzyme
MPGRPAIRIDRMRRTVSDLARSVDFYCGALGFKPSRLSTPSIPSTARLQLGSQHIDLVLPADPATVPAAVSAPNPRFQHAAIVTCDMETAWRRLEPHEAVAISRGGPQVLPPNTGGVTAFKFRDPDGHPLELIQFPAGVGDPLWQVESGDGPTLGIDHFALVVESVDKSTTFFAAHLDFRVADRSINQGIEQDRLDGLDSVEVDVVSLEARKGCRTPHLELLRYRHPAFTAPGDGSKSALDRDGDTDDEIVCSGKRSLNVRVRSLRLRDPDGHRFVFDT